MVRFFIIAGAATAGLAVALGAFGAHGLQGRLSAQRMDTFETAVRYQMYHALALFAVAWLATRWPGWQVAWAGALFVAGILLFSGSLYVLVLTDVPALGAVTPLGGVAFIGGWVLLAWSATAAVAPI
jgi:uncharacterized membrane protein YgdD (TMEM256/DUF423 family)